MFLAMSLKLGMTDWSYIPIFHFKYSACLFVESRFDPFTQQCFVFIWF